jgi:type IV secretion system protein VirB6
VACPQVATGNEFLERTLAHLDCQAQTIGSFGFQSLADPGSLAGVVLGALLALFIALYAIRLLFGPGDEPRDLIGAVLKVGIVLTMAVSWPAWRTVAYDTVLYGPSEVASAIMPTTLPDPRDAFAQRLQGLDTGFAALTMAGTGRDTGREEYTSTTDGFASVAMEDQTGFAWARTLFLATTIGSLAALRIAGGLLLALAPLFAGLLLFDLTRGIFVGWLRGLALVALGSLGMTMLLSVQLAVTEPWLADALERRAMRGVIPTAPTEMLALSLAFAIAAAALMFVLGKVAFQQALSAGRPVLARVAAERREREPLPTARASPVLLPVHSRAVAISESVEASVRRESSRETIDRARVIGGLAAPAGQAPTGRPGAGEPLGSGYRRTTGRSARSQRTRDDRR